MSDINPEISELCRRSSMVAYLQARGVQVFDYGRTKKCSCPLDAHKNDADETPSFYIYPARDGAEIFKCFSCGAAGNIITLAARLEGKKNGEIVRRLANQQGVKLGEFDPSTRVEPTPDELDSVFCQEEETSRGITALCKEFLEVHKGSEDAVNKVCRVYEMMDDFTEYGDGEYTRQKYGHLGIKDLYDVRAYAFSLGSYMDRE